jgi:DNA repair exonuclease SbcCD nuclease subunit
MATARILHLSDLHYDQSGEKDLKIVVQALIEDVKKLSADLGSADLIVFSGDAVHSGDLSSSPERNDFDQVVSILVNPLTSLLSIPSDRFIICPGNHDVQRSRVDKILEAGVRATLVDRDSLNNFADHVEDRVDAFSRLEAFRRFQDGLKGSTELTSDYLFSTYYVPVED